MKWLITGGCGFIGTSLIRQLAVDGGHFIRVVDNLSVGSREDLRRACDFSEIGTAALSEGMSIAGQATAAVQLVKGDILDADLAVQAAKDMDAIVHLAANTGVGPSVEDPRLDCVTNVIGTLNYLEAARLQKVRRFVFASSGAPAGECTPPIHEEIVPHPVSPYGASKLAGEGYCSAYFRTFGVETVGLRFGNVYGPGSGNKSSVVAKFTRQALAGMPLEIFGDGGQTRDFVYVGDLVSAILLAATRDAVGGEIFQIATNKETTVRELTEVLVGILEAKGVQDVRVRFSVARLGDVRRNYSDTSKAKKRLGWNSATSLQDGLQKTVDWFLDRHSAERERARA